MTSLFVKRCFDCTARKSCDNGDQRGAKGCLAQSAFLDANRHEQCQRMLLAPISAIAITSDARSFCGGKVRVARHSTCANWPCGPFLLFFHTTPRRPTVALSASVLEPATVCLPRAHLFWTTIESMVSPLFFSQNLYLHRKQLAQFVSAVSAHMKISTTIGKASDAYFGCTRLQPLTESGTSQFPSIMAALTLLGNLKCFQMSSSEVEARACEWHT